MSKTFDGGVTTENVVTEDAVVASGLSAPDINIIPGTGDGVGLGGTINLTGGSGGATNANGGDINITGGTAGGSGTQGTITFSALGNAAPIPFNETDAVDLCDTFTATSVVGALNELKGCVEDTGLQVNNYENGDLNYNGSTIQDVPGEVAIVAGDYLISYSLTFTTSSPLEPVAIFVRDGSNTIITESKTFIQDNNDTSRHAVSKQFIYTEVAANNTLKISYQLNSGSDTTVAVEMNPVTPSDLTVDQVPTLLAYPITGTFLQSTYTTLTDLNYNGTTRVNVPGTIVVTPGNWLVGYSLALSQPTVPDDVIVSVSVNGSGFDSRSITKWRDSNSTCKHTVTASFIQNYVINVTLQVQFELGSTASTNAAVEMSALSGVTDPDQVPILWAYELGTPFDAGVEITSENYNGTNNVLLNQTTISLSSGLYLMGYHLPLQAPSIEDNIITNVVETNNSSNGSKISEAITQESNSTSVHNISRVFLFSQPNDATIDYTLAFRLASQSSVVSPAYIGPLDRCVLWAFRIGDIANGGTFLSLTDTPSTYFGSGGNVVTVSNDETQLGFSSININSNNQAGVQIASVGLNITGSPALSAVTIENSKIMKIGDQILLSATFSMTNITPADKSTFEFILPNAANLVNNFDVVVTTNGYVETVDESLSNVYSRGNSATTCLTSFTAFDNINTHVLQVIARYQCN